MNERSHRFGMDKFLSALPSERDRMLRQERRLAFALKTIRPGDRVQSTCGGRDRPVVGTVTATTAKRLTVTFPPVEGGPSGPWTRLFRREDGRSVGERFYTWALPVSAMPMGTAKP